MTENEKLDLILLKLTDVEDRITGLEDRITGLEDRITGLEDRMTGLEDRMTGLEDRMTGLEDRVICLEHNVDVLNKEVAFLRRTIERIELRMDRIEETFHAIRLIMDNELNFNIRAIADGHEDISRKIDDVLSFQIFNEKTTVRLNMLESDMKLNKIDMEHLAKINGCIA